MLSAVAPEMARAATGDATAPHIIIDNISCSSSLLLGRIPPPCRVVAGRDTAFGADQLSRNDVVVTTAPLKITSKSIREPQNEAHRPSQDTEHARRQCAGTLRFMLYLPTQTAPIGPWPHYIRWGSKSDGELLCCGPYRNAYLGGCLILRSEKLQKIDFLDPLKSSFSIQNRQVVGPTTRYPTGGFRSPSIAGRSWIWLGCLHRFSQNITRGAPTLTLAMMPWCLESLTWYCRFLLCIIEFGYGNQQFWIYVLCKTRAEICFM